MFLMELGKEERKKKKLFLDQALRVDNVFCHQAWGYHSKT